MLGIFYVCVMMVLMKVGDIICYRHIPGLDAFKVLEIHPKYFIGKNLSGDMITTFSTVELEKWFHVMTDAEKLRYKLTANVTI
jgi:hypothetical protein